MESQGKIERKLKKELGLLDLFAIASGAMISSGLFILPGIAYSDVGPGLLFSYILASALMIPAMLSKAELATAMPKAGGTYFFIDRSVGPLFGTIAGFASWFSLAFKSAFALLGIGVFAQLLNPGLTVFQIKMVAVAFCIVFTFINLRGAKHSGKTQILLVVGLLLLLAFYVVTGLMYGLNTEYFKGMTDVSYASIFATAGLIFVSFGGLTKICSVAEEAKNPGRNIPLGMFISWGSISLLYLLVVGVTIGILGPMMASSLTPISDGAKIFLGEWGMWIMAIAAIFAFISTANAGILSASRNPMAMGKDRLISTKFAEVSKEGVPRLSVVATSAFMVLVILFLDLGDLVKTASLLMMLLFLFVMLSLIVMHESKIRNYCPKYHAPFYPWLQIIGIIGLLILIFEMGLRPILIVIGFIFFGFLWYWFYAKDKIWREYTFLHVIERLTGEKRTGYMVDEELREILIERDAIDEARFATYLEDCKVIDIHKYLMPEQFNGVVAKELSKDMGVSERRLLRVLRWRTESNVVTHPGLAIFSHIVPGKNKFSLLVVRSEKGLIISEDEPPIHAFLFILASPDQKNFYLHSLMWILQVVEKIEFGGEWLEASTPDMVHDLLLSAWKERKQVE